MPPKNAASREPVNRFWRTKVDAAGHEYILPNAEAERVDDIPEEVVHDIQYAFWDLGITREGVCSRDGETILINSRRFYGLFDLTGYPELVLRKWFNIAVTLLHELMHALSGSYCIDGVVMIEEMVFENDEIYSKDEAGEVGWAVEQFVF